MFFFSSRRRHTRWNCDWEFRRVLFRSFFVASAINRVTEATKKMIYGANVGLTADYLDLDSGRLGGLGAGAEIGRASCRERVEVWGVDVFGEDENERMLLAATSGTE